MDKEVADALAKLEKRITAIEVQAQKRRVSNFFGLGDSGPFSIWIVVNVVFIEILIVSLFQYFS